MISHEATVPADADRRDLLWASEQFVPGWEAFGRPQPDTMQLHYADGTVLDDLALEQWRSAMAAGPVWADAPWRVQERLTTMLTDALATNDLHLEQGAPTLADLAAQVAALTEQVSALIRVTTGDLG